MVTTNASAAACAAWRIKLISEADLRNRKRSTKGEARITCSFCADASSSGLSDLVIVGLTAESNSRHASERFAPRGPPTEAEGAAPATAASTMSLRTLGAVRIGCTCPSLRMCWRAPATPARGPSQSACAGSVGSTNKCQVASPSSAPADPTHGLEHASRQFGSRKPHR
eukprot:scaffold1434_cov134-Isochrysis_galbana.AAC.2